MSLRRLIEALDFEIDVIARRTTAQLAADPGFRAVQAIDGVGPVLAAIFVAEIGDVSRFHRPQQLCSWAGLTPRHRGQITKQGSPLLRWAAIAPTGPRLSRCTASTRVRVGARRGSNIGKVAAGRKLLTLVFYGLRDGHIRALNTRPA